MQTIFRLKKKKTDIRRFLLVQEIVKENLNYWHLKWLNQVQSWPNLVNISHTSPHWIISEFQLFVCSLWVFSHRLKTFTLVSLLSLVSPAGLSQTKIRAQVCNQDKLTSFQCKSSPILDLGFRLWAGEFSLHQAQQNVFWVDLKSRDFFSVL